MHEVIASVPPIDKAEPSKAYSQKSNGAPGLAVVKNIVVEVGKRPDKEFIPMVRYRGGVSIQRTRALLSFVLSMKEANICTTGKICKVGQESRDLIHLEGLHSPPDTLSVYRVLARLVDNPKFTEGYSGLREYIFTVASSCSPGARMMCLSPPMRISWTSTDTKWAWRKIKKPERVWEQKPAPLFYPFAAPQSQAVSECELLSAVHGVVPKGLPQQLRADICQELIVQILSGDVSFADIQDDPRHYVGELLKQHPGRYGPISLDSADEDGHTVAQMLGM